MSAQHTLNISELMPENNAIILWLSQDKKTIASLLITLFVKMMPPAWQHKSLKMYVVGFKSINPEVCLTTGTSGSYAAKLRNVLLMTK